MRWMASALVHLESIGAPKVEGAEGAVCHFATDRTHHDRPGDGVGVHFVISLNCTSGDVPVLV